MEIVGGNITYHLSIIVNMEQDIGNDTAESSLRTNPVVRTFRKYSFLRWFFTFAIGFFIYTFCSFDSPPTRMALCGSLGMIIIGVCLLVGIWARPKVSLVSFRILGLIVFLVYTWYVITEAFFTDRPSQVSESAGDSSLRNAILGLLVWGIPCLCFALFRKKLPRK